MVMIAGFIGGFLDALMGTGGPPIVMYLSHINVKKAVFRATCTMSFFIFHISRLITYTYSGIINLEIIKMGLILVPAMILGSAVGIFIHSKIDDKLFKKIVSFILLIIGALLLR